LEARALALLEAGRDEQTKLRASSASLPTWPWPLVTWVWATGTFLSGLWGDERHSTPESVCSVPLVVTPLLLALVVGPQQTPPRSGEPPVLTALDVSVSGHLGGMRFQLGLAYGLSLAGHSGPCLLRLPPQPTHLLLAPQAVPSDRDARLGALHAHLVQHVPSRLPAPGVPGSRESHGLPIPPAPADPA
jgi:hypothetical protein